MTPDAFSNRALARAIADAIPRHAKRKVNPHVLVVLLALADGPLTVGELKDLLGLSQSSASDWLAEAVVLGIVAFEPGADRRQHVAALTPKGRVFLRDRRGSARGDAGGDARGDAEADEPR
jgi:DNA-binding MarR family transcriptional regulator